MLQNITKTSIISFSLIVLSGCATVADLEVLNNNKTTKQIRETANIITQSANVLGYKIQQKQINTTNVNILYDEIRIHKKDKISLKTLPYALQEFQYIEQLGKSLK